MCDWANGHLRERIDKRIQTRLGCSYQEGASPIVDSAVSELKEYFEGKRKEFDLPLIFTGTPFQCRVWEELKKIPYGVTISYGELAVRIGNPKAVRAVAMACGNNPISIIVPCHRVIGSDRKLTGYDAGIDIKRSLLLLESPALPLFSL